MKKNLHIWLVGILSLSFFTTTAQGTYYEDAYEESGEDLRDALYDIISVHSHLSYSSSSTDTWDVLKASDADPNNSSNVILIYSGASVNGPQEYNNGNGWTREHVWPQSLGGFNTSPGVGTDVHNLKPSNGGLNSLRSNLEYDSLGTSGSAVNFQGQPTGCRYSNSAGVFEPRDEVKGDLARIILYMDLRYDGSGSEPNLVAREALNTGGTTFAVLSQLIKWHWADPVDSFEMNRNNVIHAMQGNRNPFIDHPELVHYLHGDSTAYEWNPLASNIGLEERDWTASDVQIFPQPATQELHVLLPGESDLILYNLEGQAVLQAHATERTTLQVGQLPTGFYTLRVGSVLKRLIIQ